MRWTAKVACSTPRGSPRSPSGPCARRSGCPAPSGPPIFRRPMPATDNVMDKLVSLAKRRGFGFQSSEIYGGLGWVWDFGPLGVEPKEEFKGRERGSMVHDREDVDG